MTPKNGGKIELKIGTSSSGSAEYTAELTTPGAKFVGRARVGADAGANQVVFEWQGEVTGDPPEWLTADARAALKAALRTSQAEGRWPRRITRWRPEPES